MDDGLETQPSGSRLHASSVGESRWSSAYRAVSACARGRSSLIDLVTLLILTPTACRSSPEAVHRVVGDEFERIEEGEDHPSKRADGEPAFAEGAPVKHLEPVAGAPGAQPRNRHAGVLMQQRVAMSVFANGHAAALFHVERLDPALDEVQNHCPALVERAARRRGRAAPGSWTGRLLRLHRWLPVRVCSSISRRLSPPFEDRMSNIITNRGRKRNEASPALGNRSSMVTPLIPSGKDTPFYQGLA